MKNFVLSLLFLVPPCLYAQNSEYVNLSFCGKHSSEYEGRSSCTVSELRNCNLVIVPSDTSLMVQSFILIIQPLSNPVGIKEIPVRSNKIPYKYLEQLCAAKNFRIEKIKLTDNMDQMQPVLPFVITVVQ